MLRKFLFFFIIFFIYELFVKFKFLLLLMYDIYFFCVGKLEVGVDVDIVILSFEGFEV